jgi:hypothetical protein
MSIKLEADLYDNLPYESPLTELAEENRRTREQLVELSRERKADIERHYRGQVWRIAGYFSLLLLLSGMWTWWWQQRLSAQIGQPAPASVVLAVTETQPDRVLCPGDTLSYAVTLNITEPAMTHNATVVRNLETGRAEIVATPTINIYDQTGEIEVETDWTLPALLPATGTRPERPWPPGHYRRLIGVANVAKDTAASVAAVDFEIGADCLGVQR